MRTYPDFTWDWIIENCENFCKQVQGDTELDQLPERIKGYIETAQGIIGIVPKLREHPGLEKLVPMKSLLSLRWFPSNDLEIDLDCIENKVSYRISVLKREGLTSDLLERKIVGFDAVADEIYAYITRFDS
jgi:hypothetical protein